MFGLDSDMIFRIPALLIALTVHEYAHARVAVWLGDPTPRIQGRLTLNPVAHLDPVGLIMLWLFKFGWAKPVAVNPANFKNWRRGMMLVSFAGPASNILMAILSAVLIVLLSKYHLLAGWSAIILQLTYTYNVILAVFNLIPIPPLDGSKILASFLPDELAYKYESIGQYGTFILIGLVYLGVIGILMRPLLISLEFVINTILRIIF